MGQGNWKAFQSGACVLLASLLTGCATVTQPLTQSISVETRTKEGELVDGAACQLNNEKGNWTVTAPGSVLVNKSATDLFIRCEKVDHDQGTAVATSRVNPMIFGNILIGGVIGAIVDHSSGSGYQYPAVLAIEMGSHKMFDVQEGNAVTTSTQPIAPAGADGQAVAPADASAGKGSLKPVALDDLKDLLPGR